MTIHNFGKFNIIADYYKFCTSNFFGAINTSLVEFWNFVLEFVISASKSLQYLVL